MAQPQQQQQSQFGQMNGQVGQMNGQMGGAMNGNMGNQQPMQQFAGVMQPDGTQAMFTPMPQQMIIMSSPTNGGMQYAAVPQMMTPTGAVVQQMAPGMTMQFMNPGTSPEMGLAFVNGQDGSSNSIQAQMDMIGKGEAGVWQQEGGNVLNGQQPQQDDVPIQSPMSGVGTSETSSQEGKLDDGSPCLDRTMS